MPNKPPAFQFYPKDWLADTAWMTLEEQGAYMRLLSYQWVEGPLPNDDVDLARRLGLTSRQFPALWKRLGHLFPTVDGRLCNQRMEAERQKQADYRTKQSERSRKSAEERARIAAAARAIVTAEDVGRVATGKPQASPIQENVSKPAISQQARVTSSSSSARELQLPAASPQAKTSWHRDMAMEQIVALCYQGKRPADDQFRQDLRWWKTRELRGESVERIVSALRGAPLEAPDHLRNKDWSPARWFSKIGPWANLYERSITADGKRGGTRSISELVGPLTRVIGSGT